MPKSPLDIIRDEQKRRTTGAVLDRFVILRESGDEVRFRFLDEPADYKYVAQEAPTHVYGGRGARGADRGQPFEWIACTGTGCPYCADGKEVVWVVIFRIFVYEENKSPVNAVKLLAIKARSELAASVAAYYERFGTLRDRDFILQRTGVDLKTRYSLLPLSPATFAKPKAAKRTWITDKERRKLIARRYSQRQASQQERSEEEEEE